MKHVMASPYMLEQPKESVQLKPVLNPCMCSGDNWCDLTYCNNCLSVMIVPVGIDECPICGNRDDMTWLDWLGYPQEVDAHEYLGCHIAVTNNL